MIEVTHGVALTETPTNSQRLFIRCLIETLIDLTVQNQFDEYGQHVTIIVVVVVMLAAENRAPASAVDLQIQR